MAKMVRQEVIDKAVGQARRRKANAIIDFKFKTELSQNINDDNVVLITATGKCCLVRRLISEGEQYLRRKMEESRKVSINGPQSVSRGTKAMADSDFTFGSDIVAIKMFPFFVKCSTGTRVKQRGGHRREL